ncbi:dihydrolipoyl dehydrogenase family protein [Falsibacillus albus]|uniref:FAD-dependent oxidoreductase n=1 Tax=Falsibacillus albus TaxID=2478915 RepID=A0A3L7K566_9BACI|nr:FAD-dependent oxidoreductase [Falsibacillus albus]RLQ97404.1 FAD-dependent oxidoreductase [Falsibacillus albus]
MVVGEIAQEKDIVIIGGGPAGYSAAIRAAQNGKEVLLIEKEELGGVCLNKGCIPSKAATEAGKQLKQLHHLKSIGLNIEDHTFDFNRFTKYQSDKIDQLRKGVEALCKANKIEVVYGEAAFLSEDRIGVETNHHFDIYQFQDAIIATGAMSEKNGWNINVNELFHVRELPAHLVLIGSSYIVLEAAFAYAAFGSKVSVVNEQNGFGLDASIEKELLRQMKKAKINYYNSVEKIVCDSGRCNFIDKKGEMCELPASMVYQDPIFHGNTGTLGIDRIGVEMDELGFVRVDQSGKTSVSHIFAAGDVTGGPFSAVKAIKQAKVIIDIIQGKPAEADFTYMPRIIHSQPPIASVGYTEEEAKEEGISFRSGVYALGGNGYASLMERKDGLVKVLFEEGSDRLLGIHIIGEGAVELIQTGVLGMELVARDEDLLFPSYAHPSLSESLLEACEDAFGLAIHQAPKAKKKSKTMQNV